MTSTRGAWLGFLASFLFILFITGKMKLFKKELIILISSLIILTLLFNLLESGNILIRFLTIFKEAGAVVAQVPQYSDGGSSRVVIWQHTVELIKVRPWLGYGPDTLGKAISDSYIGVAHDQYYHKVYFDKAHNEYLQIAFASGIPALIVYLIFLLDILLKSAKKIYSDLQIVFILACILGYIVQAFFNVSVVSVAYIYWILLGTLANTAQTK
jgi:putative inorganic carbon (HCO3(-)) transporter